MLYAGWIIKRRANIVLESYLKLLESVLFHFGWQALSRVCPFCPHCPGAIKTEPIPTMRNAMKGYGLPEPKFENRKNEFVVTLYNKAEVEKEAVNTEPVGDLLAFLS